MKKTKRKKIRNMTKASDPGQKKRKDRVGILYIMNIEVKRNLIHCLEMWILMIGEKQKLWKFHKSKKKHILFKKLCNRLYCWLLLTKILVDCLFLHQNIRIYRNALLISKHISVKFTHFWKIHLDSFRIKTSIMIRSIYSKKFFD